MGMLLLSWDANVSLNQVQQPTTAGYVCKVTVETGMRDQDQIQTQDVLSR